MPFAWIVLIGCGAAAGLGVVASLVVRRRTRIFTLPLAAAGVAASAWGLALIVVASERPPVAFAAGALALAATAAGYGLGAAIVASLRARRPPVLAVPPAEADDRVGVVVYADVEPRTYSPAETATGLAEAAEADSPSVPIMLAPFLFAAQRARYEASGGSSPARDGLRAAAQRLASELDRERFAEPAWASCAGSGSLAESVAALVERGHRTIVAVPLAVAEGRAQDLALRAVDDMRLEDSGVRFVRSGVLWCSDDIAGLVARRVLLACEGAEDSTGVALVAHGQPPDWQAAYPGFDSSEVSFLSRVQVLLVEGGMRPGNVRTAWAGWQEPDLPEVVRHLAALGCARVLACPACDPVETLDTLLDLPAAVRVARASVPARVLSAWGDAPEVARALARSVEDALAAAE